MACEETGQTDANKESCTQQTLYKVTASLLYPLRLTGKSYKVIGDWGEAELSFETIRQTKYDARLSIEGGEFDFQTDRQGWASYSRVSADVMPKSSKYPVTVLVECLNQVIQHLRDVTGSYWLHDLEEVDLFQVSVESGIEHVMMGSQGRTGGITLPVTGVTTEAEEKLRSRLKSREQVLEWRLLQLDAEDALSLGRYEEAVILGWSALESACRTEIPRLARAAGISAAELEQRVTGRSPTVVPFSLEEVAEKPNIRNLVRVCCELAGTGYDSGSLAESARNTQHLRNIVIHRGIRLSGSQARRALETIRFLLSVLKLLTSRPPEPFDCRGWVEHFGKVSVDFPKLFNTTEGRLVIIRTRHENPPDPLTCWFQLERADSTFVVKIPEGIDEKVAAALVVIANDSYLYGRGRLPHLGTNASSFLIPGLLEEAARTTNQAVHWAHASMVRARTGLSVQLACDYAVDSIWRGFTRLNHTIDSGDARFLPLCTRIASYLIHTSQNAFQRFRQGMTKSHRQISDEAVQVKNILSLMSPEDPHSICDALRAIHRRTLWLDSIVVRCPIERAEYGTRKRTLG